MTLWQALGIALSPLALLLLILPPSRTEKRVKKAAKHLQSRKVPDEAVTLWIRRVCK